MNDHSKRILHAMLLLFDDFELKTISLERLVDGLEFSLKALEEKLPKDFYLQWYEHWGDLETVNALLSVKMATHDPKQSVDSLRKLISKYIDSNESTDTSS